MPRVSHFDIPSDNPERTQNSTKKFLRKFKSGRRDYWIINTGSEEEPGINGGLSKEFLDKWA